MGTVQDKVETSDDVAAEVFKDYASGSSDPLYPCPECGKETKVHHEIVDRHPQTRKILDRIPTRICSMSGCRAVVEGEDAIAEIHEKGKAAQAQVISCEKCGAPTKEHHPDPETEDPRRICSRCQHVQPG